MKGQTKALIPALIGITVLLLAGVTGTHLPRVRQVTAIAETQAITLEDYRHQALETSLLNDADLAAREMGVSIAADLAVELKHQPATLTAQSATTKRDRG
jgi:hypothetical protein